MYKRPSLTLAVLSVATIALAACQDNSPVSAAPSTPVAASSALRPSSKGPHLTIATTSVTTAVLYPTYDNVYVSTEGHRIIIPANSVCNPLTSGYGAGTWDLPCQTATAPIVFTIKSTTDANGRPRIDIFPDVRFSPSKTVYAEFVDQVAADKFNSSILYCPTLGTGCIDESKTDPSLRTYKSPSTGKVYRRLKHFSGYHVIFGSSCVVGSDPDCIDDGTGF
jgi:hypothetical protein